MFSLCFAEKWNANGFTLAASRARDYRLISREVPCWLP